MYMKLRYTEKTKNLSDNVYSSSFRFSKGYICENRNNKKKSFALVSNVIS